MARQLCRKLVVAFFFLEGGETWNWGDRVGWMHPTRANAVHPLVRGRIDKHGLARFGVELAIFKWEDLVFLMYTCPSIVPQAKWSTKLCSLILGIQSRKE